MSFKAMLLTFLALVSFSFCSFAQTPFDPDKEASMVKATYKPGNLVTILGKDLTYPIEASANGTQGNVLFVVTIDETGQLTSVKTKQRISDQLVAQSEEAIRNLTGKWSPTKINEELVTRDYLIVFAYKIYYNTLPVDYFSAASKYEKKGKLKKAIKTYDTAIENNPYEPTYYKMRASIKNASEDEKGAEEDKLLAEKMNMEVLAVIQIAQTQSLR